MQKKTYPFSITSLTGTPTVEYFGHSSPNYDRPTSYCGKNIAYNSLGAITVYGGQSFSWSNGKLSGISSGSLDTRVENHTFQYNALGQRTRHLYSLTQNATSTTPVQLGEVITCNKSFTYDNSGRLVSENISKSLYSVGSESIGIYYLYDEDRIVGMYYTSGSSSGLYYFHRNLFGDVVAIYNSGGNKVAGYDYDAWGNCTITSDTTDLLLARTNPIRYRGYYYDEETGLYWVSSRYYSPELCMFISPDSIEYLDPESVNGLNLYAYCGNDPVNKYDPSGHAWETVFDIGFAIWSLIDFIKDPTWANAGWLASDVLALAVPFLPGGSKVITKADDIVDAVGFVNKYDEVIVLGQSMGKRVIPYADEIGATFYKGLDNFKDLENSIGTVRASLIGYFDNMWYIAKHTFNGAKFIDKGFDAARTLKGLKGMDLFIEVMSRVTIHSEKFLAQLLRKKNVFRFFRHWLF